MTNIPDHALPIILTLSRGIEDFVLTGMDKDSKEFRHLRHLMISDNFEEFPEGGIDWDEPELEEDSKEFAILKSLEEIAIALMD